jgi:hypothetical protein
VCGELAGNVCGRNRRVMENWVQKGYPALMVIYQGRTSEFFAGEVPTAFDWMDRQRRATGFPQLGRNPMPGTQGEQYQTMRVGDNRFYWVTVESLNERYENPQLDKDSAVSACVQAEIRPNNQIVVNSRGIRALKLWFGRVWDPEGGARWMIDFARPVRVSVNRSFGRDRKVTPSLETMLEDLYLRGDRQRLFMAAIELTNLP